MSDSGREEASMGDSDRIQKLRADLVDSGLPSSGDPAVLVTQDEYEAAHGETLAATLDLGTWHAGADLNEMYGRLEQEVEQAVRKETEYQQAIRREVFPLLRTRPGGPQEAGVYQAQVADIQRTHRAVLFNGAVEACDGTVASLDTLPVTITQIGVCLVSYQGDQGSWVHRTFRRDLRVSSAKSPVEETLDLLERRRGRGALEQGDSRDRFSELGRRGIMAYAERAVLLDKSAAPWRMGHGNPTPYELVTGSGMPELLRSSLDLLDRLVTGHRRFVFVPSAVKARELLTIGNALAPLEYAVIDTNEELLKTIAGGHYRGDEWAGLATKVSEFARECGSQVLVGVFRASAFAPAQVFYSHRDHVHEAALIAMADSVLQEHRGFPMLIELADGVCTATFGADTFNASTQLAYAAAGAPFRYFAERRTRK